MLALEVQKRSHEREEKTMPGVTDLGLGMSWLVLLFCFSKIF